MTTYTPGPWFKGPMILDDNGITHTCSVGPYELDTPNKSHHYEDTICEVWDSEHDGIANARLIAAAPDLLEAAETALNVLLANCIQAGGVDDRKHIIDAQAMLRKAIAKATS